MKLKSTIPFILILLMAMSCKPPTIDEMLRSAAALNEGKHYADAINLYTQVIAKNNKIQSAYYNRGLNYIALKNYPKALNDFNEIMELQPRNTGVTIVLSKAFARTDEEKGYIGYYEALYMRAQTEYYMDSARLSFHDFQTCINNYYQASSCKLWQGTIWLRQGKKDNACALFEKAWLAAANDDERFEADEMMEKYCGNPSK
jgi:tetratricopeptide (TPR) repeat protein